MKDAWQETVSIRFDLAHENLGSTLAQAIAEIVNEARLNGFAGRVTISTYHAYETSDYVVTVRRG